MSWKQGPLPPNTWHWGGVVLAGSKSMGFYFADFHGDHAKIEIIVSTRTGPKTIKRRVEPDEVEWYSNCLEVSPTFGIQGRAGTEMSGTQDNRPSEPRDDLSCEQCKRVEHTELYWFGMYEDKKSVRLCDSCLNMLG